MLRASRFTEKRAICLVVSALMMSTRTELRAAEASHREQEIFRSTVELVQLQVDLVDAEGAFPQSLTASDFVLRVNGVLRPVQLAYPVTPAALLEKDSDRLQLRPTHSRSAAQRRFLFVFDLLYTTRPGFREARRAALEYLESRSQTAQDLVGIATIDRFGARFLLPFTRNLDQVRRVISDFDLSAVTDAMTEDAIDSAMFLEHAAVATQYAQAIEWLANTLLISEGRKQLLLFSKGIPDEVLVGASLDELEDAESLRSRGEYASLNNSPEYDHGSSEARAALEDAIMRLRGAGVVVHSIDPRGLRDERNGRQMLSFISSETGGMPYWNLNDLTKPLGEIDRSTSSYYVVAYSRQPQDPMTSEIDVAISTTGIEVLNPRLFHTVAPDYGELTPEQRTFATLEALANDDEIRGMEFECRVTLLPHRDGRSAAVLYLEIPPLEVRRLLRDRGEGVLEVGVIAVALTEGFDVLAEGRQGVRIPATAAESLATRPLRMAVPLEVPPGAGQIRVLVRESSIGNLSARSLVYESRFPSAASNSYIATPLVGHLERHAAGRPGGEAAAYDVLRTPVGGFVPHMTFGVGDPELVILSTIYESVPSPTARPGDERTSVSLTDSSGYQLVHEAESLRIVAAWYDEVLGAHRTVLAVPLDAQPQSGPVSLAVYYGPVANGLRSPPIAFDFVASRE